MVAVISVDAYHFLAFSDLTCLIEDTGIGVFCCTLLWCGDISGGVDISEVLRCHLLWQTSSQCVS